MNETLRVLIVDDEPLARQAIRMMIGDDPEVTVVGECSGAEGCEIVLGTQPDIMFLDIRMPEVDGFELLEHIGVDRAPTVIFVTAYADHALRAYAVHAVDYLLKPVDDTRFQAAFSRAKTQAWLRRAGGPSSPELAALLRRHSRETRRILVRDRDLTRVIELDAIDWIEAADYYAEIHTGGKTHLLRETMNELEERLLPGRFCRIHRSIIVNLDRVREIRALPHGDRDIVLADGTTLRLSRGRREEFERLLASVRRVT
ncbi:MAG TPA: LytTR family DNA-binding domain-containing protein [Candidatus Eisenbacteria bacterium]|nr:LytTR family DNA-binding domain-containing protein [Candidatus Eisenbacteria bacterium]